VIALLLIVGLAAVGLAGEGARVDYSAIDPGASDYPVSRLGRPLCGDGGAPDGSVLAAAIITYGRRPGRSAWGHTSLRFLACEEGLLRDVEYEYYRMGSDVVAWFLGADVERGWTGDRGYLRAQGGRLVLLRNERPADGGTFARELRKNREVIEAWMPWSAELRERLYTMMEIRYADQRALLVARRDLTAPDYAAMRLNCTLHIREALAAEAKAQLPYLGSVYPMRNLTSLQERGDVRFVLHPSPHVVRAALKQGSLPEAVDVIPRPLFRRRSTPSQRESIEGRLSGATPVVVEWLLDGTLSTGS